MRKTIGEYLQEGYKWFVFDCGRCQPIAGHPDSRFRGNRAVAEGQTVPERSQEKETRQ
jgi:hypothetical protein